MILMPGGIVLSTLKHEPYMHRAISLGRMAPQRPFGALLVDRITGVVIAEGFNRTNEHPLWHGEIDAINRCIADRPGVDWGKLLLYSTAEPCPMCMSALAWVGVAGVVFGSSIEFLSKQSWWQIEIPAAYVAEKTLFRTCEVLGGILEADCNELFLSASSH